MDWFELVGAKFKKISLWVGALEIQKLMGAYTSFQSLHKHLNTKTYGCLQYF